MATPFSKSLTAIQFERRSRISAWLLIAGVVLVLWFAWFFAVPVAVYSLSQSARLEVYTDIQPIHAPVAGRIDLIDIALGAEVNRRDVLLTLDSTRFQIQLREAKQRLKASDLEFQALNQHIQTIESAGQSEVSEVLAELTAARARVTESTLAAEHAQDRLGRMQSLHQSGNVSEIELTNAKTEFNKLSAAMQAAKSELHKIEQAGETRKAERKARVSELKTDLARLERERVEIKARISELNFEIAERVIRAPFAGRIGELADLYPGMQVQDGQRLAVFVPQGELQVEAFFEPGDALGHIRKGQQGRLKFEGFPWTQYGSAIVTVTNIAEELRNGLVEVKLAVSLPESSVIPLQHGMPATVEIEIEKALPVELVLRAAGKVVRE